MAPILSLRTSSFFHLCRNLHLQYGVSVWSFQPWYIQALFLLYISWISQMWLFWNIFKAAFFQKPYVNMLWHCFILLTFSSWHSPRRSTLFDHINHVSLYDIPQCKWIQTGYPVTSLLREHFENKCGPDSSLIHTYVIRNLIQSPLIPMKKLQFTLMGFGSDPKSAVTPLKIIVIIVSENPAALSKMRIRLIILFSKLWIKFTITPEWFRRYILFWKVIQALRIRTTGLEGIARVIQFYLLPRCRICCD